MKEKSILVVDFFHVVVWSFAENDVPKLLFFYSNWIEKLTFLLECLRSASTCPSCHMVSDLLRSCPEN